MSYQEIIIIGHLGRDPEMRYTPGGVAVARFPVATNRRYHDVQGELIKETVWFQVSAWKKQAENATQYLERGSQVMVRGRLNPDPDTGSPRIWEKRDGSPAASYEVTAREIIYLDNRSTEEAEEQESGVTPEKLAELIDEDIPF
jgi:single-strand DNA-binding protein